MPFGKADFGSEAWIAGEVLFALRQAEAKLDGKPSFVEHRAVGSAADKDRFRSLVPARRAVSLAPAILHRSRKRVG